MRIFKKLLPLLIGFALFLGFNGLMNYFVIPYQFTRVKIHRIETKDYQDLILGSSHANSALNPSVMKEKTGRKGFNAAAGGQFPMDNYYLLRDALKKHSAERVILEYDPTYWVTWDSFNRTARYQLSVMEPSTVKLAYFAELCLPGDLRYVFLPWSLYDINIERMKEIVEGKHSKAYRKYSFRFFNNDTQTFHKDGFLALKDYAASDKSTPQYSFDKGTEENVKKNRKQFERILKLCRERDIEVVVVTTPVPPETFSENEAFYAEAHEMMQELLQPYGYRFLDFVAPEETEETAAYAGAWDSDDFSDGEGHMRVSAANEFSAVVGEMLGV